MKGTLREDCPKTEIFWSVFSCVQFKYRKENAGQKKLRVWTLFFWSVFPVFSPNTGKYGPEKAPFLDTFHAVVPLAIWSYRKWSHTFISIYTEISPLWGPFLQKLQGGNAWWRLLKYGNISFFEFQRRR